MIDPTREIPALIEAVKAGFMSLSEVQKSFGYVPEEVIMALEADIKRARDKELYLSIDGRNERKVDPPVESTSSANTR